MVQKEVKYPIGSGTRAHFTAPSKVLGKFLAHIAQWSEGVTKPPWSSEQIEVNLSFLEAFGYILSRKVFLYIFNA